MYILAGCTLLGWVWFQKIHFHCISKIDSITYLQSNLKYIHILRFFFYQSWVIKLRIYVYNAFPRKNYCQIKNIIKKLDSTLSFLKVQFDECLILQRLMSSIYACKPDRQQSDYRILVHQSISTHVPTKSYVHAC